MQLNERFLIVLIAVALALCIIVSCVGCSPLRWCGKSLGIINAPAPIPNITTPPSTPRPSKGQGGEAFPWDVLLGWTAAGLLAGIACWLVAPIKPLAPIGLAAGIGCGVAVCFAAYLWQIVAASIGVTALVFGFMWLRRTRTLKKLVTQLQTKRDADEDFKAKMNETVDLSPSESKVVDRMRKGA